MKARKAITLPTTPAGRTVLKEALAIARTAKRLQADLVRERRKNNELVSTLTHVHEYWRFYPRDPQTRDELQKLITDTVAKYGNPVTPASGTDAAHG